MQNTLTCINHRQRPCKSRAKTVQRPFTLVFSQCKNRARRCKNRARYGLTSLHRDNDGEKIGDRRQRAVVNAAVSRTAVKQAGIDKSILRLIPRSSKEEWRPRKTSVFKRRRRYSCTEELIRGVIIKLGRNKRLLPSNICSGYIIPSTE